MVVIIYTQKDNTRRVFEKKRRKFLFKKNDRKPDLTHHTSSVPSHASTVSTFDPIKMPIKRATYACIFT